MLLRLAGQGIERGEQLLLQGLEAPFGLNYVKTNSQTG